MKVTACPKCGSKKISMGTIGSGVTFGITSWIEQCRECGYQGQSIIFESEREYKEFIEKLKGKKQQKRKTDLKKEISVINKKNEVIKLSKKDNETIKLLKEFENEKTKKPVWPKNKIWWPEIVISLLLAIFTYFTGLSNLASLMGIELAILFGAINFIFNFIVYLFLIVIIEYVLVKIKNIFVKTN